MGVGNYTQTDVRGVAPGLHRLDAHLTGPGAFKLQHWAHDFGEKVFLGHRGDLAGEDVIAIVTHTPGVGALGDARRMWSFLAYPVVPHDPVVGELAPGYAADLNMTDLLRAILPAPGLPSPGRRGGSRQAADRVGRRDLARAQARGPPRSSPRRRELPPGRALRTSARSPSTRRRVGGWGNNQYWLSTAASLAQLNFAQAVAQVADLSAVDDAAGGRAGRRARRAARHRQLEPGEPGGAERRPPRHAPARRPRR